MKKSEIIFASMIGSIALGIIIIACFVTANDDYRVIKGYYQKEKYLDKYGFQHYLEYYKYFYTDEEECKFAEKYMKIDSTNINEVKLYYNDFNERMNAQNRMDEFDFNQEYIDEDDYFLLYDKSTEENYSKFYYYELFYYDSNLNVLYVLHSS